MLRIKRLDIFILKSFCMLFVGTFFICLFIFMMQFLWKYVDVMVGKGLEMSVLAQFFFYSALTLIPLSLPLAVLLASLITFGNFGERFELLAMKAAGISLIKIMRPLIVLISLICCVSFYFQNVIGPYAQKKLWTLVISMKQKSPELDIPEGVFYDEISGYNLFVKHKDRKTGMLYDVLIYNLAKGFDNAEIIKADSGRLEMTADKKHLYLRLYSGEEFGNLRAQQNTYDDNFSYAREKFREKNALIDFDSDFNMIDEGFMSTQSNSKNLWQLQHDIDSIKVYNDSVARQYYNESKRSYYVPITDGRSLNRDDSLAVAEADLSKYNIDSLLNTYTFAEKERVYSSAMSRTESIKNDWDYKFSMTEGSQYSLRRHMTGWHEKLTLSLACLMFFFIGAPLGGIIRKGGLGMPVVISVLIFIFYYILNNTGYKMARDGHWIVWMGMWMSTLVLAPIGGFLTYKSNNDSVVFNPDLYMGWIKKVLGIRSKRHLVRKEVVIDDPDYDTMPERLSTLSKHCSDYAETKRLKRAPNYLRMWLYDSKDEEVEHINDYMEKIVEELANTRSQRLLACLNEFPIIPVRAHLQPFRNYWLNLLCGLAIPVGIFFYIRIWIFRIRLSKDMETIINKCREATAIITEELTNLK